MGLNCKIYTDKKVNNVLNVVMLFIYTLIIVGLKQVKLERKLLHILNVLKPLHVTVIFTGMKKHILD